MKYQEIKSSDEFLSNFIKCFWYSETEKNIENTILPNGYIDLIFNIENKKIDKVKITGIWSEPITIKSKENTIVFGVRFKPLIAEILKDIDFKTILNSSQLFYDTPIYNDCYSFENLESFSKQLEKVILELIINQRPVQEKKVALFKEIFKKETFNVTEISKKVFWSSRQINRYFNSTFGISLKTYLKIIRCNTAYRDIANNKLIPQITHFDQPHFIKEVKKFTGCSPGELSKNIDDRFLQLTTLKNL